MMMFAVVYEYSHNIVSIFECTSRVKAISQRMENNPILRSLQEQGGPSLRYFPLFGISVLVGIVLYLGCGS